MEFTPKPSFGEQAVGEVTLEIELRTPTGDVAIQGSAKLHAAGNRWEIATMPFEPPAEGEYKMKLTIPNPVGQVDIEVKEHKK